MASLIDHPRSRFYFVDYRDPDGKVRRKTLKIEKGTEKARRLALKEVAEYTALELGRALHSDGSRFSAWVHGFFELRYKGRAKTLQKYLSCWKKIEAFLVKQDIRYPGQIRYTLIEDYMRWRTKDGTHHNTARLDIIVLGLVMREAVRRGFATANPLAQHGVAKLDAKEKAELTDEDIAVIREALLKRPEWMGLAFEIALLTGCRLSETSFPMANVDFQRRTITFPNPKGGRARAFTTRFTMALLPVLQRLKEDGRKLSLELPQRHQSYPDVNTNNFFRFFKALHDKKALSSENISFHSTRVTFITRHARARTDERIVKKLVNHSSTLVHQIYSRLRAEDATDEELEIGLPPPTPPPTS